MRETNPCAHEQLLCEPGRSNNREGEPRVQGTGRCSERIQLHEGRESHGDQSGLVRAGAWEPGGLIPPPQASVFPMVQWGQWPSPPGTDAYKAISTASGTQCSEYNCNWITIKYIKRDHPRKMVSCGDGLSSRPSPRICQLSKAEQACGRCGSPDHTIWGQSA